MIIGGGFGGMLAAVRLQEAGITNFRIVEKAGDFGGTWYWNRYPGAQCDVEGYLYLPLLEETGYIPKERYSFAPEIFAHAQRIGKHFHLYEKACFQTEDQRGALGRRGGTLDGHHRSRRCVQDALRDHVERAAEQTQVAGNSRDREIQGAYLPYQPLGLRLHWRGYHWRDCTSSRTSA